jgi:glycosyltransferase involved in cell wall biosynthesis
MSSALSAPDSRRSRVAVLIPALNEEATLPGVLARLPRTRVERVVVVDNGSSDDTARVASEGGADVVVESRRGYGAACLAGIDHLEKTGSPDVLVFMDGDQSDDPEALDVLLEPILAGRAQFVLGTRMSAAGCGNTIPLHARLGNLLVLWSARVLHGARFGDLGPFRAISFDALRRLRMDDRNWGWTLQMQLRAHRLGISTVEVPVVHRPRAGGRSKVSGTLRGSARAGGKMLLTLLRERLRGEPRGATRESRGPGGASGAAPPPGAGGRPREA